MIPTPIPPRAIFLTGFMASGKSTIGRLLAARLGWLFVDLDSEIEAEHRAAIPHLFETFGEPHFRHLESTQLAKRIAALSATGPTVIALGGGAYAQPANVELIGLHGAAIWLDCPFDLVSRRVQSNTNRPLARDPLAFRQLYDVRRAAYALAPYRIAIADDDPRHNVDQILALPLFP